MGIAMGLHVRVGQEDNLWGRRGERATSVQQIEKMVKISEELWRPIATADQAREIYKIGTFYSSIDETLEQNGWLPNRKPVDGGAAPGGVTIAADQQAEGPGLRLGGVRAHLRPAHLRLYGAAGAERRVPAAEGGVGTERRPARLPVGRRRADGRAADLPDLAGSPIGSAA